jgi:peptide deformylase
MTYTMRTANGLGLAANQVGKAIRAFAVDMSQFDVTEEPRIIINPEVIDIGGMVSGEEGCLSFPGLYQIIERPEKVAIKAISLDGKEYHIEAEGLLARVMLHEIDHLNGVLFIDKIGAAQRKLIKGKLEKIKTGTIT